MNITTANHPAPLTPKIAYVSVGVAALLGGGVLLTGLGLWTLEWPACIPFTRGGLRNLAFLLGGSLAGVLLVASWFKCRPITAGFIVFALISLACNAAWPLFVALWIGASCFLFGKVLTDRLEDRAKHVTCAYLLVGAACLGTLVGILAHFPVNTPLLYASLLGAPFVLWPTDGRRFFRDLRRIWYRRTSEEAGFFWLEAALAVLGILHATVGLMPDMGWDSLAMHLFIPGHMARRAEWGFHAGTYAWAVMPMLADWLFSVGYILAGEQAARLVNVLFLFVLGHLIYELSIFSGASRSTACVGILLLLSTPLTFTESSNVMADCVWACYFVAATTSLIRFAEAPMGTGAQLVLTGLFSGAALAAKAWSFVTLPALALTVLAFYPTILSRLCTAVTARGLFYFLAIGSVPYATAWLLTGNPVFPFFNGIFKSPLFDASNFTDSRWISGIGWSTIYDVNFHSALFIEGMNGVAGFQWLLALVPSAFVLATTANRRGAAVLCVGTASTAAVFSISSYLRYVFPSQSLLLAAIGAALPAFPGSLQRLACALLGASIGLNLVFLNTGPNNYSEFPIQTVCSNGTRDAYITSRLPLRKAFAIVDGLNISAAPVALFGRPFVEPGVRFDVLHDSWYSPSFHKAVRGASDAPALLALLRKHRIEYVVLEGRTAPQAIRDLLQAITTPVISLQDVHVLRLPPTS